MKVTRIAGFSLVVISVFIITSVKASLELNDTTKNFSDILLSIQTITNHYAKQNLLMLSEEVNKVLVASELLKILEEPKIILSPNNFTDEEGLFIFFGQKGHSYKEVLEKIKIDYASLFLIIWMQPDSRFLDIQKSFGEFWTYEIASVVSLVEMKYGGIYLYTYYPYTTTRCSDPGPPVFLDSWNAGKQSFDRKVDIFAPKKVSNLQSCPLICSGTHAPPDSIIVKTGNNTYEFSGIGGMIFNFMAKHLNFTPVITRISDTTNSYEGAYSNETSVLGKDILSRKVDIGFGKFSTSTDMHSGITFAKEIEMDCFTWAVPFRAGEAPAIWKKYVDEFYGVTWILIFISFIVAVIVLYMLSHISSKEKLYFRSFIFILLYSFSTFLGSASKISPCSTPLRTFLTFWFLYSLVITTAYQASLGSIVTIPAEISNLEKVDDVLASKLSITGSPQMYFVLNASTSTSDKMQKLLKRFEVQPPGEFLPVVQRVVRERNVVVFANKRLLLYSNTQLKDLNVTETAYIMPECLIKLPSSPMLLRRGSPYQLPIDKILTRLIESGIISHWSALNSPPEDGVNRSKFTPIDLRNLKGAFCVLFVGQALAIICFILELVKHKWFNYSEKDIIEETNHLPFVH